MQFLQTVLPAVIAGAAVTMAVAAERVALAESRQAAPVTLGGTLVSVALEPLQPLSVALKAEQDGRQIYLVIESLRAQGGVEATFEVYLDLPPGLTPRRDDPHYIGDFNFFGAEARGTGVSFNVTGRVQALLGRAARGEPPTVTIVPNGTIAPEARPSVGRIALIAMTR